MPSKRRKPPVSPAPPSGGTTATSTEPRPKSPNLRPAWQPGQSGNPAGRPQGDHRVRKIILEALGNTRKEAVRAMETRLRSPKYVQDVLELLAKLEGELSKDAGGESGGVKILVLNNMGDQPLDPETFRAGMLRLEAGEPVAEIELPPEPTR